MAASAAQNVPDVHMDLTPAEARALRECMVVVADDPAFFDTHEVAVYSADTRYIVNPLVGFCECPADQYHEGPCKHRERVAFERGAKPIPRWVNREKIDPLLKKKLETQS